MDRRELIKKIAILTGAAFLGADLFLVGCKSDKNINFALTDITLLDEIAETIIPKTKTPGAKDAETGKFIAGYVADCYSDSDRKIVQEGVIALEEAANRKYDGSFIEITKMQKQELLMAIAMEAKEYNQKKDKNETVHYFTLIKQLTLLGFFTSEVGATQVLRYNPIPGKYEGCLPYIKGEKAWF